ncbi:MAG: hypothetical protein LQ338_006827 [Usnochroma carphineum]|nr:MAG: hypothetical protein LQ338_006827 [Usnochroma carphineum]
MEAVGLAASIATLIGVTAKTIKYLNKVREASADRSRLFDEASSLLPLLGNLKNQVEQESNKEAWFDCVRSLAVGNGPIDQLREAFLQLTEKLKPKKEATARGYLERSKESNRESVLLCKGTSCKYTSKQMDTSDLISSSTLTRIIQTDTAQIAIVDEHVLTIARDIDGLKNDEDLKRRQQILEWLSPLNFFKTQQDTFARREEGTGQWLLDSPFFQNWLSGIDRTLCCPGIPGAGKSVLASVVVDFLRTLHMKHDSVGVAAVYCNFKERDQQSPKNLLAGCCAQLVQHSQKPLSEVLNDVYNTHNSRRTRPEWEDIARVFNDSITNLDTVYLVVDALDECSEDARKVLLKYFKALPANTRLLVTTRHVDEITREFRDSPKVEIHAHSSDLKKYITSRIASNRRLEGYVRNDSSLEPYICDRVTAKADGMFLAAKLHVDSISTKTSVKMLKRAIENLSDDLNVLYKDALSRIESQNQDDRKLAEKALGWVAYTYRPLRVRALQEALAIGPEETDFDDEAMPPIGLVLDVCAGLLILDEENDILRLVHYTAQDYFDAIQGSRSGKVHATIASDCITYLSYERFQQFESPGNNKLVGNPEYSRDKASTFPSSFRFLTYASGFWAQHAIANQDADLSIQIHRFLAGNPRTLLGAPLNTRYTNDSYEMTIEDLEPHHGLEIAAFFGLCDHLEEFCKGTREVDASTGGYTPLHQAARNDQAAAVEFLLDHGADIERRDPHGLTPLHRAIYWNTLKAATALVKMGADIMAETTGPDRFTPIASVTETPRAPFLELLLEAGAWIRTSDIFDETPLMQQLVWTDDVDTAETLFELHSAYNLTAEPVSSQALPFAVRSRSTKMIDMLLKYGADINSKDVVDQTALHIASQDGDLAVMKRLLAHGADIEAQGLFARTSLSYAAKAGHEDCVLALLHNGAEADVQDICGMTAVHMASIKGSLGTMHELVKHHVTISTRSRPVLTLKHYDSAWGGPNDIFRNDCILDIIDNTVQIPMSRAYSAMELRDIPFAEPRVEITISRTYLLEEPRELRYLLSIREKLLEVRVWEEGVTAFDIAVLREDDELVCLLESLAQSPKGSHSVLFEEYLFDLLGVSSVEEADEELKWREEEQERWIEEGQEWDSEEEREWSSEEAQEEWEGLQLAALYLS